jgi:hypothetical protein
VLFLPRALPKGVHVIATTRPPGPLLQVADRRDVKLRGDDPRNMRDVQEFVRRYLDRFPETMQQRLRDWRLEGDEFLEVMVEKSEGNFMYLHHMLPALRDRVLDIHTLGDVKRLPRGLGDYYTTHWQTMRHRDPSRFDTWFEPVLCVLAIVREPIDIPKLQRITGLPSDRIRHVIDRWHEFLSEDLSGAQPRYRVYHASFRDFLAERVDLTKYHGMIVDSFARGVPGLALDD